MSLNIILSDIDVKNLGKSEREIRLDLAVFFYLVWQMPAGRCADYVGISKVAFLDELGKRKVPVNYDLNALELDFNNLINHISLNDSRQ